MTVESTVSVPGSSTDAYFSHERQDMHGFLPERFSTALDIGCAEGRFLGAFADKCETWGIEPNADAASRAAGRIGRVLTGFFEEAESQLPDEHFDLVVCNDVIEHMPDPTRFLTALKRKMKPGGTLVASVPNVRFAPVMFELIVRKDWKYRDAGVLDRTHLRFFTERSFRRLLEESGFKCEVVSPINMDTSRTSDFSRSALAFV
jgi:2-polyprenyl-3-methyl-5-hydroxy-6-metoxy-1,4-benzoquinol methylase